MEKLKIAFLALICGIVWTYVYTEAKTPLSSILGVRVVNIQVAQAQIETPEPEVVKVTFTPMEVIKKTAKEEGMDWKVLYGICMEESRGCQQGEVGDGGSSFGWFQIHFPDHPGVTSAQAHDIEFSSHWTAKRLKHHAAIGGWDYAIRKHNGNADYNTGKWKASFAATLRYLNRVKSNISTL